MFRPWIYLMALIDRITHKSGDVLRTSRIKIYPIQCLSGPYWVAEATGIYNDKERPYFGRGKDKNSAIESMFNNMRK